MSKGFEPQTFTAKFLYKGVAVYKEENVLINTYIEDIANTFIGANVTIGHVYDELKKGDPRIVGTVVKVFCNKEGFTTKDGKFIEADCDYYADFVLFNEAAINSWRMMGFVSCAYTVLEAEGGGTYINGPYNSEIKRVRADEFAIVSSPRYEDSKIIKNSNEPKIEIMDIKNGVKSESNAFTALEKALDVIGLKFSNSKKSKANDQAYDEDKKMDEMKNDKGRMINGELVAYGDLENCWKNSVAAKKNAEDEEEKAKEKKNAEDEKEEKEAKKNAEDEEGDVENSKKNDDKEEKEEVKENSKKKNSSTPIGDARNSFANESKSVGYLSPSALAREMFDK
ncbi:MAG: hypothetical protein ACRC6O_13485 [Flavobacterium sp.]